MQSKNEIANEIYGMDFTDLPAGKKAAVSREYNNQNDDGDDEYSDGPDVVEATVGKVGYNGTKTCLLPRGSTVKELLAQAAYTIDEKKDSVHSKATGEVVDLDEEIEDGETYMITKEIKSA